MAKRTIDSGYAVSDTCRSLDRKILSYSRDGSELYYEYGEAEEPTSTPPTRVESEKATPAPSPVSAPAPAPVVPVVTTTNAVAAEVEDVPVPAGDVVRALVAQKLKKPFEDVPSSQTIKVLSGGNVEILQIFMDGH